MSRQPSKSLRGSPPASTTAARPSWVRLYLAMLIAIIAVAFLGYRIYSTLTLSHPAPRLSLGANVPLLEAPPPAGDDRPALKAHLERLPILRANAPLSADSRQAHL